MYVYIYTHTYLYIGVLERILFGTGKRVLLPSKGFEITSAQGPLVEELVCLYLCFLNFPWEGPPALGLLSELLFLRFFLQDDLLSLKVVSVLHHLSIKRAIQVLRINNFEPNCLRRRPSDEVAADVEIHTACASRACDWLCEQNKHPFLRGACRKSFCFPQSLKSSLLTFLGFIVL